MKQLVILHSIQVFIILLPKSALIETGRWALMIYFARYLYLQSTIYFSIVFLYTNVLPFVSKIAVDNSMPLLLSLNPHHPPQFFNWKTFILGSTLIQMYSWQHSITLNKIHPDLYSRLSISDWLLFTTVKWTCQALHKESMSMHVYMQKNVVGQISEDLSDYHICKLQRRFSTDNRDTGLCRTEMADKETTKSWVYNNIMPVR